MPFEKKFELLQNVPANWEVAAHMVEFWEKRLQDAAESIKDKLDEILPDDGTFERILVNPAVVGFDPVLNPAYVSKRERTSEQIRATRHSNLLSSFARWKANFAKAFATVDGVIAKVFKERVSSAKDRWAIKMGAGTLRFTGDKIRGLSVAPILAYFLTGEERATGWIPPSDMVGGNPYNIARAGERSALKASILQRIVQGGVMITNASDKAAEITSQNGVNTTLLNGFRDTAKAEPFVTAVAADKCFCLWETDADGRLLLHTQVGLTV